RVIGKHLAHEYARVAVVDADGDFHFLEGEDCGIRLLLIARDQHSGVPEQQRRTDNHDKKNRRQFSHECSFCSGMRTRPLSVPMKMKPFATANAVTFSEGRPFRITDQRPDFRSKTYKPCPRLPA